MKLKNSDMTNNKVKYLIIHGYPRLYQIRAWAHINCSDKDIDNDDKKAKVH
jgi:hypothetical protein